jgi:thiamine pyrophosphokinase
VQPTDRLKARLRDPYVIAADSGAATALAFGLTPHVVMGDLDSIAQDTLAEVINRGSALVTFSRDKDETDSQLAVARALQEEPTELLLIGFLNGPRLDMTLANTQLLLRAPRGTVLLDERNEARLLRSGESHAWPPERDELISLMPVTGDCRGVTTTGMRWELSDALLSLAESRGVSNQPLAEQVSVRLGDGALLLTRHFARL